MSGSCRVERGWFGSFSHGVLCALVRVGGAADAIGAATSSRLCDFLLSCRDEAALR